MHWRQLYSLSESYFPSQKKLIMSFQCIWNPIITKERSQNNIYWKTFCRGYISSFWTEVQHHASNLKIGENSVILNELSHVISVQRDMGWRIIFGHDKTANEAKRIRSLVSTNPCKSTICIPAYIANRITQDWMLCIDHQKRIIIQLFSRRISGQSGWLTVVQAFE